MPQNPAHMKKVTLADQTQVNKASSFLRDILKRHIVLTCVPTYRAPYACHVHTLFIPTHMHTHFDLYRETLKLYYWQEGYQAL